MSFLTGKNSPDIKNLTPVSPGPVCHDPEGSFSASDLKILLIFVTAGRLLYNFSGVLPMIPLGVAYLTAYLKKHGYHNIAVIDQPGWELTDQKLLALLSEEPFDIYALSTNIFSLSSSIEIASYIKKSVNPEATVVIGGPSAAFTPQTVLSEIPEVDFVQVGEGEEALLEIVRRKERGEKIENIPGLYWRDNGQIKYGGPIKHLDLKKIPFPVRDLLPNHLYNMHPPFGAYGRVAAIETIRGCNYGCNFCSIQQSVRFRPVDHVIEELSLLAHKGYREFHFVDPTFSIDRERAALLCEAIISKFPGIYWTCKNRTDTVSPQLLKLMKQAGCYMIAYGIESGDNEILRQLNKKITVEEIRRTLQATRKANIRSLSYILIGSPGESEETVKNTVQMLIDEKVDFALFGELMPDTESPLFRNLIEDGSIPETGIRELILHKNQEKLFSHTASGQNRDTLHQWVAGANKLFYRRPSYVLQRLQSFLTVRDACNMVSGVYHLAKESFRSSIYEE